MFHPRSLAFVGATETMGKWGSIIFTNLISGGYQGKIYPINPGREHVYDYKAYPSVKDIPDSVDLAVFTIPANQVKDAIEDCIAKGVKAGVIISAGFKELGGENVQLEAEIVEKARTGNMILAGPNGQGICCPEENLYPWMPNSFHPNSGPIGVVSQSGNIQSILIDHVLRCGFGVSKSVSSGNEADLKTEDYYEYLANDAQTQVILSYLEGITDGRRFFEKARQVTQKKPIVLLKGGRTDYGSAAAKSHTGALAVSSQMFEAACRQAGIIRAHTMEEAAVIASAFVNRPLPRGRRVGIITGGGGLGVIASDACADLGLEVAKLSLQTLKRIEKHMPDWWVPGNPVDLVAGMNMGAMPHLITALTQNDEIDALMILFTGPPRRRRKQDKSTEKVDREDAEMVKMMSQIQKEMVANLKEAMKNSRVPSYMISDFRDKKDRELMRSMVGTHLTTLPSIEIACAAVRAMASYYAYKTKCKCKS